MSKIGFLTVLLTMTTLFSGCTNSPQVTKQETESTTNTETAVSTEETPGEASLYTNKDQGYSINIPAGWHYKETAGTAFKQVIGLNPNGTPDNDFKILIGVLTGNKEEYLNKLNEMPHLKIDQEIGDYKVNELPAAKFVYKNNTTGKLFNIITITVKGKTFSIMANEELEKDFLDTFQLI